MSMATKSISGRASSARPLRRVAAFFVHLLTATGAAISLFALVAAIAGEFTMMFVLLALALVIDGFDGSLARRFRVAEVLPRWSGDVLDLVVDYLSYVFVPAFALATGALLPPLLALPAAVAILISSAIYFADTRMKTEDGYFRGFPALWNVVAFYLFILQPAPWIALGIVAAFIALMFAPILIVHPLRAKGLVWLNVALLAAWAASGLTALAYHLSPPPVVTWAMVALAVYFFSAGLFRRPPRSA
jgi:phosphatidylcholine synthase